VFVRRSYSLTRIIHEAPTATAYLLDLVNDFRAWHRRLTSQYVEETNAKIVHQVEQIRSRSRRFMNNPG